MAFGTPTGILYSEGTFTPIVTLVGGAGNVVPVYVTNTGRFTRIGNRVFVDINLTGDGGAEGGGTGVINITLPLTAGANNPPNLVTAGNVTNGTEVATGFLSIAGSATVLALHMQGDAAGVSNSTAPAVTGVDQNNIARTIRLQFFYEV